MLCTVEPEVDLAELEASWEIVETVSLPRPRRVDRSNLDSVVAAAVGGSADAAEDLLTFLRPIVVRYCRTKLGRAQRTFVAADDVAQEVCLAVLGALPRYSDQPGSFLPFVYGIAAHKVADHYRRAGRDKAEPAADVPDGIDLDGTPEQQTVRADVRARLVRLLDTLAPRLLE